MGLWEALLVSSIDCYYSTSNLLLITTEPDQRITSDSSSDCGPCDSSRPRHPEKAAHQTGSSLTLVRMKEASPAWMPPFQLKYTSGRITVSKQSIEY